MNYVTLYDGKGYGTYSQSSEHLLTPIVGT